MCKEESTTEFGLIVLILCARGSPLYRGSSYLISVSSHLVSHCRGGLEGSRSQRAIEGSLAQQGGFKNHFRPDLYFIDRVGWRSESHRRYPERQSSIRSWLGLPFIGRQLALYSAAGVRYSLGSLNRRRNTGRARYKICRRGHTGSCLLL